MCVIFSVRRSKWGTGRVWRKGTDATVLKDLKEEKKNHTERGGTEAKMKNYYTGLTEINTWIIHISESGNWMIVIYCIFLTATTATVERGVMMLSAGTGTHLLWWESIKHVRNTKRPREIGKARRIRGLLLPKRKWKCDWFKVYESSSWEWSPWGILWHVGSGEK